MIEWFTWIFFGRIEIISRKCNDRSFDIGFVYANDDLANASAGMRIKVNSPDNNTLKKINVGIGENNNVSDLYFFFAIISKPLTEELTFMYLKCCYQGISPLSAFPRRYLQCLHWHIQI
jgi:hypothetical protein